MEFAGEQPNSAVLSRHIEPIKVFDGMLFSVDNLHNPITRIPHERQYRIWTGRLSSKQYQSVVEKLNSMIDGDEVHTSSWMPGENWTGTAFQPIWEIACLKNDEAAAKCFGLILWEVMMERPKSWSFGRFEKDNMPIEGMTYFKV
jgi:hypothetical protein